MASKRGANKRNRARIKKLEAKRVLQIITGEYTRAKRASVVHSEPCMNYHPDLIRHKSLVAHENLDDRGRTMVNFRFTRYPLQVGQVLYV